ncbi:MAG: hypothetical protein R2813_11315 [Flavobacteriales bacterium]
MAQTPHQYVARGDKELLDGFPESALFYYRLALKTDTHFVEAHFKAGEAYRTQRNYKRAASHYQHCANHDEQDMFPDALLWLGIMQTQMGEYQAAKRSLQHFLSIYRQRDELYRQAREAVESCDWALDHEKDEPKFKVEEPDSGLNTIHAEMSPYLLDSNTMYFATMRYESDVVKKNNPVYVEMKKAIRDSTAWQLVDLDLPISNATAHVGNGCFSEDSARFYYSLCPTPAECSIYVTKLEYGSWSAPQPLPSPVNESGCSNTQPMIAVFDDHEYLFFSSDRVNGKGGYDLWFVEVKNGEPLTRIRNLGNQINSRGNEITPWYDAKDTALYFSSNRQLGFGGYDIYKSVGKPGSFNAVENAGTVVNSPADDYYFAFKKSDSLGYFASNRISGTKEGDNETCCNDLYKVRLIPVIDTVDTTPPPDTIIAEVDTFHIPETIEQLQDLLPISLYFHNDRPDPRSYERTTKRTYVQCVEEYIVMRDEYLKVIAESVLDDSVKIPMYDKTQRFFEKSLTGSVDRVNAALDVLLKELEDSSSVNIAVKGYASPLAASDYNLNLTYRRIDAMENYIRKYQGGAFVPFLDGTAENGARMTIEKIPYGESQASSDISDALDNRIAAIYGPKAANERRIEILRVEKH